MQSQQAENLENVGTADGLATVREAAAYLKISVAKLYLLMESGELPSIRIGKSRRLEWHEIKALVVRSRLQPRQP